MWIGRQAGLTKKYIQNGITKYKVGKVNKEKVSAMFIESREELVNTFNGNTLIVLKMITGFTWVQKLK